MKTKTLALAGLVALTPIAAFAAFNVGDKLGTDEATIRAELSAQGYEVQKVEIESDEIEVKVMFEGQTLELEIDPQTGLIAEVEDENSDDDHDAGGDDGEHDDEDEKAPAKS